MADLIEGEIETLDMLGEAMGDPEFWDSWYDMWGAWGNLLVGMPEYAYVDVTFCGWTMCAGVSIHGGSVSFDTGAAGSAGASIDLGFRTTTPDQIDMFDREGHPNAPEGMTNALTIEYGVGLGGYGETGVRKDGGAWFGIGVTFGGGWQVGPTQSYELFSIFGS
ncbi:MAG: hypothetical protein GY926_06730 [bacterium]|nr:hypothetical protein [bacterium]MCP4964915.1 hypothetical protein [bacterium]